MSTSTVASLIAFEAEESPPWRGKTSEPVHSVKEMVQEITKYQTQWQDRRKKCVSKQTQKKVDRCFLRKFLYHINIEEGHGCDTMEDVESCLNIGITPQRDLPEKERETVNLLEAYYHLLGEVERVDGSDEVNKLNGLLEVDLVKDIHRLILQDIVLPKNSTKPGQFSKNKRVTWFNGERYEYADPKDLEQKVQTLLDRYNDLITYCVKEEENLEERLYKMFKTCAFLLFELLDLHPFGDGNGRLCRLLCSYALQSVTPFPTPIYNVWSDSCKDDYIQALVDTRKSESRHPTSLTTMIIECNYHGWNEFFKEIGN
jgi:fido (protein-threonine AMPylation protein)